MPIRQYYIFLAEMELQGILTFSSEIRPAVGGVGGAHITSPYISNYPLIYAFNKRICESYATFPSLHLPLDKIVKKEYPKVKSPLRYTFIDSVLRSIQQGELKYVYAYPAEPVKVTTRRFFLSAKGYGYAEKVKKQVKTTYPTETNWISLVPPTILRTVVISPQKLPNPMYIRIGMKRTGLFKVKLYELDTERIMIVKEPTWSSIPVNLYDVRLFNYTVEDYVKVLETRSEPSDKPGANAIGYVLARGLYEVATPREERLYLPLPKTLMSLPRS